MNEVFVASDCIVSSLGFTSDENFENIRNGVTGIRYNDDKHLSSNPLFVSTIETEKLNNKFSKTGNSENFTRLEKIIILAVSDCIKQTGLNPADARTLFILSSTKGNIDLLDENKKKSFEPERIYLWNTAELIAKYFNNHNKPILVSTACTSGVSALYLAFSLIKKDYFDNVIVIGADIITDFVLAGFKSFQAISSKPCRPFDSARAGISLGEACGAVILSKNQDLVKNKEKIKIIGGATSNDANHISGPSRTGDGLFIAISNALKEAQIDEPSQIDFISAHGTATEFNDEMESKAITLAKMNEVPVNSLKGYFGHTLGAAGIIESIISIHSMKNNLLIKSLGYENHGVTEKINVIADNESREIKRFLKTASGFGGCNAAIVFER